MTTLTLRNEPLAVEVRFDDALFHVTLDDGRELAVPIDWFPRLRKATATQRANWRLIGHGEGIHWDDVDEDISTLGLLAGFDDATRGRRHAAE